MIDYTNYQGCATYSEALKFLEEHNTSSAIPFEVKMFCSMALEKQIPKKPAWQNKRHQKCPECGSFAIMEYCARCGQKIDADWIDEE